MTELKHTPGPWGVYLGSRSSTIYRQKRSQINISNEDNGREDARLIAEAPAMVELLRELAADLKIELDARYSGCLEWPSQKRRYDNDMEPVIKARALLKRIEGKEE